MKSYFQQLNTLFFTLLAAQLLFCGLTIFIVLSENPFTSNIDSVLLWVVTLMMAGTIALGFRLYRNSEKGIPSLLNIEQKMEHYRQHSLIRWACIEGPNMFMIVIVLLERNQYALFLFFVGIAIFWFTRPSREAFEKRYGVVVQEHGLY
jgi:hypothetical protein